MESLGAASSVGDILQATKIDSDAASECEAVVESGLGGEASGEVNQAAECFGCDFDGEGGGGVEVGLDLAVDIGSGGVWRRYVSTIWLVIRDSNGNVQVGVQPETPVFLELSTSRWMFPFARATSNAVER